MTKSEQPCVRLVNVTMGLALINEDEAGGGGSDPDELGLEDGGPGLDTSLIR